MARPRINKTSTAKGKGTSFGKKSEAEQSFLKKKKSSGRSDEFEERKSFGKNPRSSGTGFSKPGGFRNTRDENRGERPFSDKPTFRKSNKPFGIRPDGDRFSKPDGAKRFPKSNSFRGESTPRSAKPEEGNSFHKRGNAFSNGPKKFDSPRAEDGDNRPYGRTNSPPSFGKRTDTFKRKSFDGDATKSSARISKDEFKKQPRSTPDDGLTPIRKDNSSFGRPFKKSFVKSRVSSTTSYSKKRTAETKVDDGQTRLNKYIANSGVGSRRDADELIKMGLISVNGTVVTELGTKVKQGDVVRYEDKVLKAEKPVYILLNKPKGFITTTDDPQERNTVMALVAGACKERIYPVGRLDRNTTGLLLLTNDGELADKLTHPSYKAKKVYKVELDKPLTKNDFIKIQEGVHLQEGKAMVDDIAMLSDDSKSVGLEIHIGWNRVVRRIFESLGYEVIKLDRSVYAGLDKKDVGRGQWRFLKPEEVVRMKHFK